MLSSCPCVSIARFGARFADVFFAAISFPSCLAAFTAYEYLPLMEFQINVRNINAGAGTWRFVVPTIRAYKCVQQSHERSKAKPPPYSFSAMM
jgi:hypothetical protein